MINTLLVEDDLYIQRHFVERFSEDVDIRIVAAVREGRGIYDNIRKAIQFLLSSNMSDFVNGDLSAY